MQPKPAVHESGAVRRAGAETRAAANRWTREWADADAVDRAEAEHEASRASRVILLGALTVAAAGLAAIFPLTPGFSPSNTIAAIAAAAIAAAASLAVVVVTDRVGRGLARSGTGDTLIFTAATASAGAAAIHLAVAKMHFDEYTLFGVFFVGSGIAQLIWPVWLLLRRSRLLLILGALGNALIVVLWAVDRIWGLPLGPTPWKPDPFGFGDSVASALEVVLVAACIASLVRGRRRSMRGFTAFALTLAALALTAASFLSVLGVGASVLTPTK